MKLLSAIVLSEKAKKHWAKVGYELWGLVFFALGLWLCFYIFG
ncbi:MAG: hypothetical protein WAX89_05625 [Alphaproteobacteria bacterium]